MMELKPLLYDEYFALTGAFNRTMMELKRCRQKGIHWFRKAFNRTMMELKLNGGYGYDQRIELLIAP